MRAYQREFLDLAIQRGVLRFGSFKLKSGRLSPYFFDAGLFNSGRALMQLGRFYAQAIIDSGIQFDLIFGPAYKGIPLAVATAIALADQYGRDVPYCFNRKEVKTYGEGGFLVGASLEGRVLLVDDVITAGTAVRESVAVIEAVGGQFVGVIIALDRQERTQGELSSVREIEERHGVRVASIVTLRDLVAYLGEKGNMVDALQAIESYRTKYGV